jgi:hypothetical protein
MFCRDTQPFPFVPFYGGVTFSLIPLPAYHYLNMATYSTLPLLVIRGSMAYSILRFIDDETIENLD